MSQISDMKAELKRLGKGREGGIFGDGRWEMLGKKSGRDEEKITERMAGT